MNPQSIQKLFAFIIVMMFSASFLQAQCKKNQVWVFYNCGRQVCVKCVPRKGPSTGIIYHQPQTTSILITLGKQEKVSAKIYDATGKLVKTIADSKMSEGYHQIEWDAKDDNGNLISTGTYVLKLETGGKIETKKFNFIL